MSVLKYKDPADGQWKEIPQYAVGPLYRIYTTYAALVADWSAAPDGAQAWTTSDTTLWVRIAGVWGPQSMYQWSAFTPAVLNLGRAAVTKTLEHSRYIRQGKMVTAQAAVVITGASAGTGDIRLELPVPAAYQALVGTFVFQDASDSNKYYLGGAHTVTGSPSYVYGIPYLSAPLAPFTTPLAVSDVVRYAVTYEVL